jgi:Family of unknown function (DUF6502)
MSERFSKALVSAVARLLRPLVRIMLRNGVPCGTFEETVRWVYADIAMREFGLAGKKPSVSRAAVITGLSRKEIVRLQLITHPDEAAVSQQYNRAASVITGWLRDPRFNTPAGEPADLNLDSEFAELVKSFSRDVPARAVLDELRNVGAVEYLPDDRVRLLARAYIPHTDDLAKLEILGTDVKFLLDTLDHNLICLPGAQHFQRKVVYDNLPAEVLAALHAQASGDAQALLETLDKQFSAHDRDINPAVKGTGRKRAGVGIYYFEEDFDAQSKDPS